MTSVQQQLFDENAPVSRSSLKQQQASHQDRRSVAFATPRKPLGNVSNDPTKSTKRPTTVKKSAFTPKPRGSTCLRDAGTPALRPVKAASSQRTAQKATEATDSDEIKPFEDFLEPPAHEFNVDDVTAGFLAQISKFTPALPVPAKPKKQQKKKNPKKSSRNFLVLHKPSHQEVAEDDYLLLTDKDKEYLAQINLDTLLC